MPFLAIFTGPGITPEMYDALRKEVDWEHHQPKGAIFHSASFDEAANVAHVADVWNSPDDLNAFASTRLMPAFQKLNIPPPQVAVYPLHNVNAYPEISQYMIK